MSVVTDYVTLAAMKVTLDLGTATTWDNDLGVSITAASRAVDGVCNRRFYLDQDATSVRYYTPDDALLLDIDDLNTLTTLKTDTSGTGTFGAAWTLHTDFELEPLNAQADPNDVWPYTKVRVRPYGSYSFNEFLPRSVQLTGQFGWPQVPQAVVEGTTLFAERLFKIKREAPLGILAFQDMAVRIARTDQNLIAAVGRYMKTRAAVA